MRGLSKLSRKYSPSDAAKARLFDKGYSLDDIRLAWVNYIKMFRGLESLDHDKGFVNFAINNKARVYKSIKDFDKKDR